MAITIREFIRQFEAGEFENPKVSVQIDAGWHDWFCRETSLRNKTRFLGRKVIQLAKSERIDLDRHYVFFKNNCPLDGNLYDSFSICDIKTDKVLFWICPSNGYNGPHKDKPMITDFTGPAVDVKFNSWREVRKHFGV